MDGSIRIAIRVWRSNYVNFIFEHSKIIHRRSCSTSGVWGSWSWLFSPATLILFYQQALPPSTPLSNEETCRPNETVMVANSCLEITATNKLTSSRHLDRPLTSTLTLRPLCRWRDRQFDKKARTPLPPRGIITSIPF
ncbi:hypothetical protein Zmor_018178 [Zophobas morio]|uniref:Uncharacterized protein n=1 Tax=Zophobas morio TaxID=2755281 RepID=A0AA38MDB2_9CUCU|nr:hypothetical protein Zmor_018178 [Zophobas morio]